MKRLKPDFLIVLLQSAHKEVVVFSKVILYGVVIAFYSKIFVRVQNKKTSARFYNKILYCCIVGNYTSTSVFVSFCWIRKKNTLINLTIFNLIHVSRKCCCLSIILLQCLWTKINLKLFSLRKSSIFIYNSVVGYRVYVI